MTSVADLQFDKMDVDTTLAQNYIEKNKSKFNSVGTILKDDGHICDDANNDYKDFLKKLGCSSNIRSLDYFINLNRLADNIQENIDLFCQLEFLNRQKPIQTTKLELNMIIKHVRCQSTLHTRTYKAHVKQLLVMNNHTPLIDLGCVVLSAPAADILVTDNTVPVCYLFTQLCHRSGINSVKLATLSINEIESDKYLIITKNKVLESGCIGVITTQSDVDSAVDVFVSAPKGDLWGIRRILVQESAVERFKSEFAWKTRSGSQADVDPQLKSLCTDLYVYDDKVFLREYVGNETNLQNVVLIESFRTVKELLTLIESYSPFCVSLWSHGVAESNEIAFGITTPIVWINRYGTLGEPHQISSAYFSQIIVGNYQKDSSEMEKLRRLQKDWMKLTQDQRRRRALDAVTKNMINDDQYRSYAKCVCTADSHVNNFVHVGASELVIGIHKPRDFYKIQWENSDNIADIIYHLLNGTGLLISALVEVDDSFATFVNRLEEAGLPIHLTRAEIIPDTFSPGHTTRIIHSSFGTIFAN